MNRKSDHNNERRRYRRFTTNLSLEIRNSHLHVVTETRNLSCSGIFCRIGRYIPLKTKLSVTLRLPLLIGSHPVSKEVTCAAEVMRVEPPERERAADYDIGIAFTDINDAGKKLILQFIRQKNVKESRELKKMYLELKDMAARLVELEECHPTAEHFRQVIDKAVIELDAVAHLLDYEINELKTLECDDEQSPRF